MPISRLRELDNELAIAQRTLASRQKSLRLTQLRLERGVATRLDVRQAETLLYTAAATIPDCWNDRWSRPKTPSACSWPSLLGTFCAVVTLTEQPIPPEIPAGLPAALLERRPDIRASEEVLVVGQCPDRCGQGAVLSAHLDYGALRD